MNKYGVSPWPDGYGRLVSLGGAAGQRLGVSCDLWARHHATPLWLGSYLGFGANVDEVRRKLEPLRQEDPHGLIDEGKDMVVPIKLREGVEYDAVLDAVVARLKHIAELLGPAERSDS